ncbi:hypothetical protein BOSE127_80224 [Bosea sp. 127]|nr:hypothetical protein BOSE127_80224 [Bosea sp. 127]
MSRPSTSSFGKRGVQDVDAHHKGEHDGKVARALTPALSHPGEGFPPVSSPLPLDQRLALRCVTAPLLATIIPAICNI